MNSRIIAPFFIMACTTLFVSSAFSQDTSQNQKITEEEHTYPIKSNDHKSPTKQHIYRDTRLGGSSPYFNTYEKNDYGAGAITTDPNKANGIAKYPDVYFDSSNLTSKNYRDTRLGGSSPGHKTYKTNDYGAGAITTNPNKGNSSGSSTPDDVIPAPDSTKR